MAPSSDSLTLINFFDKLFVAGLICCCAIMLRKEAALRLLAVLSVLFIGESVAESIGLASTAAFLKNLLYSSPVILAVIFQSDIKRALFSFWKRHKPDDGTNSDLSATVDELSKGLHELAERRIGALIVIIRQMSIDHMIQVGTEIDAKVTSELLNSIFLPYSPIHDGAVIIQRDKITRAGCFLPLTQNPDIAKSFGTRHRAALGISEQTDVLVLVVSEETGKISIVHDGKITYDADPAEIRRLSRKAVEGKRVPRAQATAD
ncbi:MAG: TIGR00159 family protein [Geobacteraceae bacterium GWC2_55_20]|nr:MAG: TIGR00159 family protein [Geobacteraceae bacterium GWC2_55_20]OGU25765.1 MAG: TIGR00159 family protein [Geobacteraceae bacterium GWF2_54_21]HBA72876.1 TIGR00159 family protein [Geobacter sp.]HCE66261.1 TIGR00159 family protein [Geobacter sp.]